MSIQYVAVALDLVKKNPQKHNQLALNPGSKDPQCIISHALTLGGKITIDRNDIIDFLGVDEDEYCSLMGELNNQRAIEKAEALVAKYSISAPFKVGQTIALAANPLAKYTVRRVEDEEFWVSHPADAFEYGPYSLKANPDLFDYNTTVETPVDYKYEVTSNNFARTYDDEGKAIAVARALRDFVHAQSDFSYAHVSLTKTPVKPVTERVDF